MKRPSRSRVLCVAAFLIVAAVAIWSARRNRGEPTISYIGFGAEDGERVALFWLQNPGESTYDYAPNAFVEEFDASGTALPQSSDVFDSLYTRSGVGGNASPRPPAPPPTDMELRPHAGVVTYVSFARPGAPLRFHLRVSLSERPRERLAFLPRWLRSWFPKSMLTPAPPPPAKYIWSEVVTP